MNGEQPRSSNHTCPRQSTTLAVTKYDKLRKLCLCYSGDALYTISKINEIRCTLRPLITFDLYCCALISVLWNVVTRRGLQCHHTHITYKWQLALLHFDAQVLM
jgi:hypothetical protein